MGDATYGIHPLICVKNVNDTTNKKTRENKLFINSPTPTPLLSIIYIYIHFFLLPLSLEISLLCTLSLKQIKSDSHELELLAIPP